MRPLTDQTILVTGSTDGHGRGLATELAGKGAHVLVHGRSDDRGRATVDDIRRRTGNDRVDWLRADLSSLDEVRSLAERIETGYERLDALVNNAGIGATTDGVHRRETSKDGYELRFAVNYLAGYLLTRLLVPSLRDSAPSRIVNVTSVGQAPIHFDDVMLEDGYDGIHAYGQSKLAQIIFTFDLADQLDPQMVTTNCLHPATYMPTKIVLADGAQPGSSLEEGVEATLRLIADPTLDDVTGRYFKGQREGEPLEQAQDPDARRRLRDLSDRLVGLVPTSRS